MSMTFKRKYQDLQVTNVWKIAINSVMITPSGKEMPNSGSEIYINIHKRGITLSNKLKKTPVVTAKDLPPWNFR